MNLQLNMHQGCWTANNFQLDKLLILWLITLLTHYKDHSFVIDADEASNLLGKKIIKEGTKEYALANNIYEFLEFSRLIFDIFKSKEMRYVGSVLDGLDLYDKKK